MSQKIQLKRGTKASLPSLNLGEPAFVTDTNELFIGGTSGNINITEKEIEVVSILPSSNISVDKIFILNTDYSLNYYDGSVWHTLNESNLTYSEFVL